ncbi:MAG: hypothetical protein HC836_50045, partial [Richelia sp. RM2_1_2]|nr:hypothetical protein [Richelia sp. RM2_1_2]
QDDRNYFFQDKDNSLYLYVNVGTTTSDVIVSGVTIYDYNGDEYLVISGSDVQKVKTGIYKINLTIDSATFPDAVLFTDKWTVIQNGKVKNIDQEFYLINSQNYFSFSLDNRLNFDDFYFTYSGIKSDENLKAGTVRRINVKVKTLYSQDNNLPLDLDYRVFTTQSDKYQIDIIPFTKVDRTSNGYEFMLDTTWMIPQDYYLELRINNGDQFATKAPINFTIVDNGLL